MTKEQVNALLGMSAGHPYYRLKRRELDWDITELSQKMEIDQEQVYQWDFQRIRMDRMAQPMMAQGLPLLEQLAAPRVSVLLKDWELEDIKTVRLLCDAFVRFYKSEDSRGFQVGSAERFVFLNKKCTEVQERISSGGDFWLAYQHLDSLVSFCLMNRSFLPRDERFQPIKRFLCVLYDFAAKALKECLRGESLYSTQFVEAPEEPDVDALYGMKKRFLDDPYGVMQERERILAKVEEKPTLLQRGAQNLFYDFELHVKNLRLSVLGSFNFMMRNGGNLRNFLVYDSVTMRETCNLCREIHATLSNEAVFRELYVVQREFYEGRLRLSGMTREMQMDLRNDLRNLLERLLEEQFISEEVYDEEVKRLDRTR